MQIKLSTAELAHLFTAPVFLIPSDFPEESLVSPSEDQKQATDPADTAAVAQETQPPVEVKSEKPKGKAKPEEAQPPVEVKSEKPKEKAKPEEAQPPVEVKSEKPKEKAKPEEAQPPVEVKSEKPKEKAKPEEAQPPVEVKSEKPKEKAKPEGEQTPPPMEPESSAQEKASPDRPSPIKWRPKANSQVLFILKKEEMANKELTGLLKKIVASLEIPFAAAGFGTMNGVPSLADFKEMPNPWGVVFDSEAQPGSDNPVEWDQNNLFFSHTLAELSENVAYKKELWGHLQKIKARLG